MNPFQYFWNWLDGMFSEDDKIKIKELQELNQKILQDKLTLVQENTELKNQITEVNTEKEKEEKQKELENYWNTKRENNNDLKYYARPMIDSDSGKMTSELIQIDPRIFFQSDCTLPKFTGNNDEIAKQAHMWVSQNITYTTDKKPLEHWQFAYETVYRGKGDCEDGGVLIANILLNSGVPYWRIRINAGDVNYEKNKFGHAYCTYLSEKDNQWYVLDWCFFPENCKNLKQTWKKAETYIDLWFSFNAKFIYGDLPKEVDKND